MKFFNEDPEMSEIELVDKNNSLRCKLYYPIINFPKYRKYKCIRWKRKDRTYSRRQK